MNGRMSTCNSENAGADTPNSQKFSETAAARESNSLLKKNLMIDADEEDDVRLHYAALHGEQEELRKLLLGEAKESINFRVRPYLSTPLRLAVTGGNTSCVQILLASGAHIDLEDIKGQTPLFVATSQRNLQIIEILLKAGANVLGNPKNRSTTVLNVVRDGFAEGLKLLLEYGANCDPTVSSLPSWPLQHSIVYCHFSCFLLLLQYGAKPYINNKLKSLHPNAALKLSVTHAIIKYASDYPEFIRLYHENGGDILELNHTGKTALDSSTQSPAMEALTSLAGQLLSLKSLCRLRIRQLFRIRHREDLALFIIPQILKSFLLFEEYEKYASKTKANTHVKIKTEDSSKMDVEE